MKKRDLSPRRGPRKYDTLVETRIEKPLFRKDYTGLSLEGQFLDILIKQRIKNSWSQKDLAEKMGVSQPLIARFEGSNYTPTLAFIEKIARALNVRFEIKMRD